MRTTGRHSRSEIPSEQPSLFDTAVRPHFEAQRADWLAVARAAAKQIALRQGEITVNDVRDVVPPPDGKDPRVMGAVFRTADWELVGYRRSKRDECHNRPIAVFRLKQRVA